MHVDGSTLLVLGDTGEGQPGVPGEMGLYKARGGGEAAADVDDESVPQLGGVRVPQHVGCVVVAVGAQRPADDRRFWGVHRPAADGASVFAGAAIATGAAPLSGAVDGAEGRSSEGDEEPGTVADRFGDVLAAEKAGADQVEGVPGVQARAGRTDGGAAVAAADEETFAGFVAGVVVVKDLAGRTVQGGGGTGEVDGVDAAAGCGYLLQPAGELRVLGDADGIAVCFGELTQARRAVENGAPVSRGEFRGDGGGLPGWAAETARVVVGGALSVMGIAPLRGRAEGGWVSGWFRCPGRRGSAVSVRSRSCELRRPCSAGTSREA